MCLVVKGLTKNDYSVKWEVGGETVLRDGGRKIIVDRCEMMVYISGIRQ